MEVDFHSSQSENESETKCWLTNLFNLSLQQFYLAEENLKMFYNLKGLPMKASEARSDTE